MRVAVNLTWLTPGRVGGSEEYLTRQLLGLDDPDITLELFVAAGFRSAHPELASRHRVHVVPWPGRAGRLVAEHTWLAAGTRHADLVHHGGGTVPLAGRRPSVVTVHDLQYRSLPGYFSAARRAYLTAMVPRSVRRASYVAVPSRFVRDEVVDAFDVDPDHVVVVPHGVPHLARPDADQLVAARARYGLGDRRYVVYPAITHPHKAHRLLVDMLHHLDDALLVLIGGEGAAEGALAQRIATSTVRSRIVRTGRVPTADRDALISGADALVFPSEFEGFGAPVVEAMALDTPVVCSDAAALVEVVGEAAIVVDEASGAAWADGVHRARRDADRLVAAGRIRRQAFTLAASGEAIAEVYRRAAA